MTNDAFRDWMGRIARKIMETPQETCVPVSKEVYTMFEKEWKKLHEKELINTTKLL